MSTPVSQLKNTGIDSRPAVINNDQEVQEIISAMEREGANAPPASNVKATHVATFPSHQQHGPLPPPSYSQSQQYQQQQWVPPPSSGGWTEWLDTKDAQTAVIAALVALCFLYPTDMSFIYNKFSMLTQFQQYDMFIRTLLLAAFLYLLLRKFM